MDPNDQNQTDQPVNQPAAEPTTTTAGPKCQTCGTDTSGYKCAICGEESATHDDAHPCGGDKCQPKCVGCNQAESKCSCGVAQTPTESGTPPATPGM